MTAIEIVKIFMQVKTERSQRYFSNSNANSGEYADSSLLADSSYFARDSMGGVDSNSYFSISWCKITTIVQIAAGVQ